MDLWGLWETFLDIIYPKDIRCYICGVKREDILSHGICVTCESQLPFIESPICPKCGKMMLADDVLCLDCQEADHAYCKGISVFEFDTEVKELIHRYKYRGEKFLADPMIYWMTKSLKNHGWEPDIIVPVPLHPLRERHRGFNQARLLAKGLSKNTEIPLVDKGLLRIKNTPHQAKLGRMERRENLKGAFKVRDGGGNLELFKDKTVLLVDDVYTTGSTADQCTRALLEGGAARVYVITLASGAN